MVDPGQKMASVKLKSAQDLLDRVGVKSKDSSDVNLNVPQGGLFIMPAKEAPGSPPETEKDAEDV
jgi:hypothetical protein